MKELEKKSAANAARDQIAPRSRDAGSQPPSRSPSADEQIRMRAYELYRERGGKVGDDMADWLQAEREYLEHSRRWAPLDPAEKRASEPTP